MANRSVKSIKGGKNRPYIIGVASDMHLGILHEPTFVAFEEWCKEVQPDELFLNGDTFDFSSLSDYPKSSDALECAIDEVVFGVEILNRLKRYTDRMRIQVGNHCKRWDKVLLGSRSQALKGAKGLTLKDQCLAHGLDPDIEWVKETAKTPAAWLSQDLIARHGDMQSGKFGGAVNLCTNRLAKNNGISEILGHHHRAQIAYRTALDRTSFVMSLPTMADYEDYAPGADWQRGWATLTFNRKPKHREPPTLPLVVQPALVTVEHGIAMWGGRMYGRYTP